MATPIRIKRSAVSGKKPQNTDLQVGELALNTYDGSLFTKRDTGGVGIATTVSNITPWVENFGGTSINYSSGNVGIGSDIPTSKLDVNGSLNVSGVSTLGSGGSGEVDLQYQGVSKFKTQSWGLFAYGSLVANGDLKVNAYNTGRLKIGQGDEFTIKHDNTNAIITEHVGNININAPTVAISTNMTVGGIVTATSFESTVSTGTAPFVVASQTRVDNLNADLLDGRDTSNTGGNEVVMVTNASGGTSLGSGSFTAGNVTFGNIVGTALSVSGISTFNSGVGIADSIFHIEHPDTAIRFLTQEFAIETAGTERLRIASDGKIGVGVNDPYYNLQVNFDNSDTGLSGGTGGNWGSAGVRIENENTTVGSMSLVHFRTGDADWHIGSKRAGTNESNFILNHEGDEKLRITNDGKVGIGTDNPSNPLHITGADPQIKIQDSANGNNAQIFLDGPNSNLNFDWVSGADRKINFINSGSGGISVGIGTHDPSHELTLFGDDPIIEILEKSASSKVTIGTGTVQGFINIQKADGTRTVQISSDGNSYFKGGKVGIGTNDPDAIFDVTDSTTKISFNRTNNTPRIDFKSNNLADACQIKVSESVGGGVLQVFTKTTDGTSTEHVRITTDGKVKIGHVDNANPTEMLHVVAKTVNQDIARFTGANRDRGLVISTAVSGSTNDAVIKYNADSQNNVGQHVFLTDGIERLRIDSSGNLKVTGIATFDQNVSIGGTLTYEDVTNIDSVGIVTAQTGIKVLAGGINAVGVVTATQADIGTGGLDVDGTTDLDTLNVAEVSTFSDKIVVDTSNVSEFKGNGRIKISGATQTTKLHLQRGSTSDVAMRFENNFGSIYAGLAAGFNNNQRFIIGLDADLSDDPILIANETKHVIVGSSTTGATFSGATGDAKITGILTATTFSGSGASLTGLTGASSGTYGSSTLSPVITVDANGRITTISTASISGGGGEGGSIAGINTTGTSIFNTLDIGGDIDVDGHTELDNVNITGFTTFSTGTKFFQHTPRIEMQGGNTATLSFVNATTGTTASDGMLMGFSSSSKVGFINVNESAHGFILKTGGSAQTDERINISGVGTVSIRKGTTEEMITARPDGAVELYFNANKKFETRIDGAATIGILTANALVATSGVSTFQDDVNIGIGGTTAFFDISSGKVGIGTHNPAGKLHISSGAGANGDCRVYIEADADNDVEGSNPFIIFKNDGGIENASVWCGNTDGGTNDNSLNLSAATSVNGGIRFFTSDTDGGWETADERARITPDGELLINAVTERSYVDGAGFTQTPKLQVESNSNVDTAISLRYNSGAGAVGRRASFIFARTADGSAVSNNSVLGEVLFMGEGNSTLEKAASIRAEVDGTPGTNDMPGRLIFSTSADGSDSPTERLRIDKDGKVGIGTDNPASALDVRNASGTNPLLSLHHSNADTLGEVIRVGRTDSPAVRYHSIKAMHGGAAVNNKLSFDVHNGNADAISQTSVLFLRGDGKVGIGTDNPAYALDLGKSSSTIRLVSENDGTAIRVGAGGGSNDVTLLRVDGSNANHDGESNNSANGFSLKYLGSGDGVNNRFSICPDNQSGTQFEGVTVLQDGKIGIGTVIPSAKLEVRGDARITGILTVGESSLTLDGDNNIVNVGTALTLGHTQGIQFHTQNLHASGFEVNQINATGIITANTFKGALTGNVTGTATLASGLTGTPSITVQDINAEMVSIGGTLTYEDVTNIDSIGIVTARSNIEIGGFIKHLGDTNTMIGFPSEDNIQFKTANTERFRITSSGNVGIGTATAPHLLSVKGTISKISGTSGIQLVNISNDASQNGTIAINQSGGTERIKLHSSGASFFNGGNVGIGLTNPLSKLSVDGTSFFSGQVKVSDGTTGAPSIAASSDTNSGLYFPGADAVGLVAGGSRKLLANSSGITINNGDLSVNGGNLDVSEDIRHIDNTNTKIAFTSNTISFDTAGTERLRIDENGKVGIGITNPTYPTEIKDSRTDAYSESTINADQHQLRINNAGLGGVAGLLFTAEPSSGSAGHAGIRVISPSSGNADMTFSVRDSGTYSEKLRITSDGKVGINSTSPTNTLVVQEPTDNNSSIRLFRASTGGDIASINWATNQGNQAQINYRGGGGTEGMQFYTGGTGSSNLRAIIDTSGKVGINSTAPTAKLDIVEATSTTAVKIKSGTNTNQNTHITMFNDNDVPLHLGVYGSSANTSGTIASNTAFMSSNSSGGLAINAYNASGVLKFGTGSSQTERLRIDSAGDIFIGTTTDIAPTNGTNLCVSDATISRLILEKQSTIKFGLNVSSGFAIYDETNDAPRLSIDSSGNVSIPEGGALGINGASPQSPLDVIANASSYAVDIRGRSSDDTSEIHFCGNNSSPNYAVVGVTTTGGGQFNLSVAGSHRVGINSNGELYVGSNTGVGQGKLFVNDSSGATTTRAHIRNAVATGTAKVFLNLDDAKYASVGLENGSLVFRNSTSSSPTERLSINSTGDLTLQGGKIYGEDNASNSLHLQSTSGNSNHSRIEIGTSHASDNGGIHFYTAGSVHESSVATQRMVIKGTSGSVGINTDNPGAKLEVWGYDAGVVVHNSGHSRGGLAAFSSQRIGFVATSADDDLVFGYSNNPPSTANFVEYMRIDNGTGDVGIGTITPKTLLDVRGSISGFDSLIGIYTGGTVTYAVTVAAKVNHRYPAGGSSSSNAFYIDGIESPVLTLTPGRTYRFTHDNTGSHPLKFYHEADKTTLYTSGVDFQNTYTEITVSESTPSVLYYQCTAHGFMGNAVVTNSEGLYHVGVSTFASVINANNGINLTASDNKSILLGVHEEMRIRHTGSNSEITDEGTGSLRLGGDQIVIGNAAFDENNAVIKQGAAGYVVLKQNGTTRLQTTSTGVVVTGILTATSFKDSSGNTIGGSGVTVKDEGSALSTTGTTLNFVGNGVVASGTGAEKTITISGGGSGVTVQDEGSDLSTLGTTLNFVGSGVVASGTGAEKTITISGGGGGTGGKFVENATGIHTLGNVGLGTTNASEAILNINTGAGVTDTVALDVQGSEGSLFSVTNNLTSGSLFSINDVSGIPAFDYNSNGNISMGAFADTVAIGKTSSGVKLGVKGSITEGVHIVANKVSAASTINVDNGNVHLFTTDETTTATPNITSTVGLNTSLDTGDTLTVVIISKPNGAGYYAQLTIDGVAQTEEWLGGSAPSSAGAGGYDVNTYNVIKTGDAAYIVLANTVNFS